MVIKKIESLHFLVKQDEKINFLDVFIIKLSLNFSCSFL